MATTTFVSKVNSKDIYAKRAESSKNGVNIDTKFSSLDGSISDLNTTLGNKENTSNKKQSINDSSTTDYPSSKAVADFVNSSVATNTANYISNNGEPFTSVAQLEAYSGTVTNNDYAFVTGTDSAGNTYYDRYKATVNASTTPATVTWSKEYRLNNSSFTSTQWSSINSGITSTDVTSIGNKVDKVTSGVTNNFVSFGTRGAIKDSGKKASDFATSTQGGKADTAIQGVKLAGASSALTPDSSKVVTIPNAVATGTTGAKNGLMTADDKQSLNNAVHKVGDETITGVKTFSSDVSPIYSDSANNKTRQSKIFTPTFISEYSTWTSAQKDGNHYRQWTIDVTDAIVDKNVTASVFIVMHGSYFNTSANGTLAKLITFRKNATNYINNSQEDYVVSQSPCSEEYVISGLLKESDRFKFKVINKAPANNNYPVNLLIDLTVDTLTNLNTCTLTEEIVEGWPEWAGDKAATVKVTASGSPVLTEGSLSNYKTKQSAVSVTGGTLKGVASMTQNANGEVTLTLNDIRTGSTSQKGVVQLEDSHTSTSTTKAATPKNVKEAYDLANSAVHDSSYVHTDNNFTNSYKTQVDSNTSARHTHSNKTVLDGISSTDISNWNAKANDSDVVHKAGAETITGQKAFKNNWPLMSSESLVYSYERPLYCYHGTDYSEWDSAQKDGNHFRRWRIKFSALSATFFAMRLKVVPGFYNANATGYIEKMLACRPSGTDSFPGGSFSNYTAAFGYAPEEFRINSVTYDSELSSYVIEVVSSKPESNNSFGAILEVSNFGTTSAQQEIPSITIVRDIIEGWPSWAGDKNTAVVIQSNGMDIIHETEQVGGVNIASCVFEAGTSNFTISAPANSYSGGSSTCSGASIGQMLSSFFVNTIESIKSGEIITVSFDVSNLASGESFTFNDDFTFGNDITVNSNGRFAYTVTANINVAADKNYIFMEKQYGSFHTTAPNGFTISNYKIERGKLSTAYTRHPSEVSIYALPYEWVTSFPQSPVAGKVYLM